MSGPILAIVEAILPELIALGVALLDRDDEAEKKAYLRLKNEAERVALKKARGG